MKSKTTKNIMTFGGILAALGASACCILPLLFLALGISGAWIGNFTALESYKSYFIGVAVIFLSIGFYKVYSKPKADECAEGSFCAHPGSDRINKITLWAAAVLVGLAIAWPYIAPPLLEWIG
jgi:mercuric ion transport protein